MPKTSKRSPASAVHSSSLSRATRQLKQLPEKQSDAYTLKEAIAALAKPIAAALGKGYSYEEIAEFLGQEGIAIAPTSLRHYFAALRQPQKPEAEPPGSRKTGSRKTGAKSSSPSDKAIRLLKMNLTPQEDVDEVIAFLLDGQEVEPAKSKTPKRSTRSIPRK